MGLVPFVLAAVLGCSNRSLNSPPQDIVAKPWLNVGEAAPAVDGDVEAVAGLSEVFMGKPPTQVPGRPLNVLAMSGGGKYGAFTAGALAGWTSTGTRPVFDVATGISSGAVTATLAFLGPQYDQRLARAFTTLERSDLYRLRPFRGIFRGTGLLTAAPLEKRLATEIDEQFMADLRSAYAAGRRLYVGTGNILTNRLAIWDLGAIACSGRPDSPVIIRKILLASCSPAGMVQPVEFKVMVNGVCYTEYHSDAGNLAQAFVRSPAGIPPGSTVWVLSAGKNYRDPIKKSPSVLSLVGNAVSNSLYALFRADTMKIYALCAVTHSNFKLLALPVDFNAETSAFAFNLEELNRMYWVGYQMGAAGANEWRTTPPDTLPNEATSPRTGFQFITP